ncbi:MAG: ADP-ribosylglycohydrolase family protein [Bacteroidota bacterium]
MKVDITWIRPEQLVEFELVQLGDEGVETSNLKIEWEAIKKNYPDQTHTRDEAEKFLVRLESFKKNISNTGIQNFLDGLKQKEAKPEIDFSFDQLYDKILGGWNGRAAGCLLGKPVEKYSRAVIKEILSSNNSYPLDNYITAGGMPEEILKKYPWNRHEGKESLRENILCMTEDDDMNYAMLNLHILEKYGKEFTTGNVAETWLGILPVLSTFTAERAAYNNLLQLIDLQNVPIYHNPYREWIGAMIRADVWGWASPGNPLQAAQLAFKDASLTHTRDGVYAEMFIAAAIAISFSVDNAEDVLTSALNYIPDESRTSHAVKFGIATAKKFSSWDSVLNVLLKEYEKYFWVHSVNNIALIAAALIYGKGDFEKSICATVMGGLDTDSSGATVGSIIGTINGFNKLPSKWIAALKDKIRSSMRGFDNSTFSNLAKRTCETAVKKF